jgi:antitoxin HicB
MPRFPAQIKGNEADGYTVTFRDIPEAITQGDTLDEAKAAAVNALVTAMDFYFEDNRPVPGPSKAQRSEVLVALPPSVAATVLLRNEIVRTNMRPVDLARAMHVRHQQVTRLLDLHHTAKIDALADAFRAIGFDLEVRISPRTVAP